MNKKAEWAKNESKKMKVKISEKKRKENLIRKREIRKVKEI